jgi:UDP-glucuronate decarboxylase
MRKRVLVTGGAGFLGSHLRARLLRQDRDVLCVGNYFTATHHKVDEIHNLACPASPNPLPARPGAA